MAEYLEKESYCKHLRPEVDADTQEEVGYWCSRLDIRELETDDFCSMGERKDGAGHEAD